MSFLQYYAITAVIAMPLFYFFMRNFTPAKYNISHEDNEHVWLLFFLSVVATVTSCVFVPIVLLFMISCYIAKSGAWYVGR